MSEETFASDERTQLAVIRCIEVIGEASKAVPEDIKALEPGIPWRQIARTRDIVAHHYFGVQLDIVWQVTQTELKPLIEMVENLRQRIDTPP